MASEPPWRGLHPISLLVNLVPRTWATIRSAWPLLLPLFFGRVGPETANGLFELMLIFVFFVLAIGNTVVHFLTLRYRVRDGRLEMQSGLLNRQARVIGADRIQNMEMVRNVFHRLSGMVEVRIETASGADVEGLLSALSVDDARDLIEALEAARGESRPSDEPPPPEDVLFENSVTDLAWFGATATRLGGIAVLLGLLYEGFVLSPSSEVTEEVQRTTTGLLSGMGGVVVLLALVSGAWVVGTVTAIVRHYGFRLTRTDQALVAEQGLFTRRRAVLRRGKVQVVTVLEPWLRRLAGFSSITIETAAAQEGGDGTQRAEAMVPYVGAEDVATVVSSAIPLGEVELDRAQLRPPHPRALVRAMAASGTQSAILAGVLSWWLYPWGLAAWLLVPLFLVAARLDHQHQGWLVTDDLVVSRRGWLTRNTWLLARKKIQSLRVGQGLILRRYGLGVLQVRVAGSVVELPAMTWDEALRLQQELLAGGPPSTPEESP